MPVSPRGLASTLAKVLDIWPITLSPRTCNWTSPVRLAHNCCTASASFARRWQRRCARRFFLRRRAPIPRQSAFARKTAKKFTKLLHNNRRGRRRRPLRTFAHNNTTTRYSHDCYLATTTTTTHSRANLSPASYYASGEPAEGRLSAGADAGRRRGSQPAAAGTKQGGPQPAAVKLIALERGRLRSAGHL